MEHTLYTLALSLVPQIGPARYRHLIQIFGHPDAVFSSSRRELRRLAYISSDHVSKILDGSFLEMAVEISEKARDLDMDVCGLDDPHYPKRLRQIPDAPLTLFSKGPCLWDRARMIGIVGTRNPSKRAIQQTRDLIEGLSVAGITVISGLAFGIDASAHRMALELGIPTIGVLGGAIDKPYPFQHRSLMDKMLVAGGVLSEFPPGVKAEREHFPMRNRIIAGMVDIVIVMESGLKGGSMITARLANDYDREVGAFPGEAGGERRGGCNFLIKNHQAHLVENAADVFALMQWDEAVQAALDPPQVHLSLDPEHKRVYDFISDRGPVHLDDLMCDLKISPGKWSLLSLSMEMKGLISIQPGNMVVIR